MTARYRVCYPSGETFDVEGVHGLLDCGDDLQTPAIFNDARVYALDPRAVVIRDGVIVFTPRHWAVPAWVRTWLQEHPEWPRVATEDPA